MMDTIMNDGLLDKNKLIEMFPDNLILSSYRGSISHNTFIHNDHPNSTDDIDLMGVFFAPEDHYIGLNKSRETVEKYINAYDIVSYEFIKTITMLLKGNPNVFPLLWLKTDHYLYKNFYGRALIDNRDLFTSKHVYKRFAKYAENELRNTNKIEFHGYMGKKRKKLVETYLYDCKHASHCIRLLTMGIEFAQTGNLQVYRTHDAQELIDIKLGKWTLEEVKELAADKFSDAGKIFQNSDLPDEPNFELVNKLTKEILYDYLYKE